MSSHRPSTAGAPGGARRNRHRKGRRARRTPRPPSSTRVSAVSIGRADSRPETATSNQTFPRGVRARATTSPTPRRPHRPATASVQGTALRSRRRRSRGSQRPRARGHSAASGPRSRTRAAQRRSFSARTSALQERGLAATDLHGITDATKALEVSHVSNPSPRLAYAVYSNRYQAAVSSELQAVQGTWSTGHSRVEALSRVGPGSYDASYEHIAGHKRSIAVTIAPKSSVPTRTSANEWLDRPGLQVADLPVYSTAKFEQEVRRHTALSIERISTSDPQIPPLGAVVAWQCVGGGTTPLPYSKTLAVDTSRQIRSQPVASIGLGQSLPRQCGTGGGAVDGASQYQRYQDRLRGKCKAPSFDKVNQVTAMSSQARKLEHELHSVARARSTPGPAAYQRDGMNSLKKGARPASATSTRYLKAIYWPNATASDADRQTNSSRKAVAAARSTLSVPPGPGSYQPSYTALSSQHKARTFTFSATRRESGHRGTRQSFYAALKASQKRSVQQRTQSVPNFLVKNRGLATMSAAAREDRIYERGVKKNERIKDVLERKEALMAAKIERTLIVLAGAHQRERKATMRHVNSAARVYTGLIVARRAALAWAQLLEWGRDQRERHIASALIARAMRRHVCRIRRKRLWTLRRCVRKWVCRRRLHKVLKLRINRKKRARDIILHALEVCTLELRNRRALGEIPRKFFLVRRAFQQWRYRRTRRRWHLMIWKAQFAVYVATGGKFVLGENGGHGISHGTMHRMLTPASRRRRRRPRRQRSSASRAMVRSPSGQSAATPKSSARTLNFTFQPNAISPSSSTLSASLSNVSLSSTMAAASLWSSLSVCIQWHQQVLVVASEHVRRWHQRQHQRRRATSSTHAPDLQQSLDRAAQRLLQLQTQHDEEHDSDAHGGRKRDSLHAPQSSVHGHSDSNVSDDVGAIPYLVLPLLDKPLAELAEMVPQDASRAKRALWDIGSTDAMPSTPATRHLRAQASSSGVQPAATPSTAGSTTPSRSRGARKLPLLSVSVSAPKEPRLSVGMSPSTRQRTLLSPARRSSSNTSSAKKKKKKKRKKAAVDWSIGHRVLNANFNQCMVKVLHLRYEWLHTQTSLTAMREEEKDETSDTSPHSSSSAAGSRPNSDLQRRAAARAVASAVVDDMGHVLPSVHEASRAVIEIGRALTQHDMASTDNTPSGRRVPPTSSADSKLSQSAQPAGAASWVVDESATNQSSNQPFSLGACLKALNEPFPAQSRLLLGREELQALHMALKREVKKQQP